MLLLFQDIAEPCGRRRKWITSEFVRCYAGVTHDCSLRPRRQGLALVKWNYRVFQRIVPVLEYLVAAALPRLIPAARLKESNHLMGGQGLHNATR